MRRLMVFLACLLLSSFSLADAALANKEPSNPWHIAPGATTGVISSQMSEVSLVKAFGQKSVTWGEVEIGEGQTLPGTILFPNDKKRRLEILWTDSDHKQLPKQAQVWGDKSRWETTDGISLGTPLGELERINGKSFLLSGFDTDYEGTVHSWEDGHLENTLGANSVIVRLRPRKDTHASPEELSTVGGEGKYSSNNSVMQKANPAVYEIIWVFR